MPEKESHLKTPEQHVAALPEDLRLIGEYLLQQGRDEDGIVRIKRQELNRLRESPEEAELDLEEATEALGSDSDPEDQEAAKYAMSEEALVADLVQAANNRDKFVQMLHDLVNGSYTNTIERLKLRLQAMQEMDMKLPEQMQGLSPAYREKRNAEKRALASYIEILEKKTLLTKDK